MKKHPAERPQTSTKYEVHYEYICADSYTGYGYHGNLPDRDGIVQSTGSMLRIHLRLLLRCLRRLRANSPTRTSLATRGAAPRRPPQSTRRDGSFTPDFTHRGVAPSASSFPILGHQRGVISSPDTITSDETRVTALFGCPLCFASMSHCQPNVFDMTGKSQSPAPFSN